MDHDNDNEINKELTAKLSKIMGEMESIPKDGFNSFQNYSYVTADSLNREVRGRLAEVGLFIHFSMVEMTVTEIAPTGKGVPQYRTDVKTRHDIEDSETGATHTDYSYGSGIDSGDKGVNKAATAANKNFLSKNFMIATGDDPEVENEVDKESNPVPVKAAGKAIEKKPKSKPKAIEPVAVPVEPVAVPAAPAGTALATVVHFGKCKGHTLGEIKEFAKDSQHPLSKMWWYFTNKWEPQPYKDAISDTDLSLYKAINEIQGSTAKTVNELLGKTDIKDDMGDVPMEWQGQEGDDDGEPDF